MGGERAEHVSPAGVAPLAALGDQRLGVVDDDQQPGPLHHLGKPGQEARQAVGGREQVGHLEAIQVALQGEREVGQRAVDRHAVVGSLVPDELLEGVLVTVGQLQRAGGLAPAGHAMQQDSGDAARGS